ncbi:hypothetical protein COV15_00320 [Candidatus Woesearchaeota archaeon CG10_big_fil_rev_8_21_14_0_10_34_12]|nr:MAG: hypothetical protein COV15_00320 [Candidatus Woesearchaeota archaeon CG10_big_fil_rev_8_21_14_0_10_34_12]
MFENEEICFVCGMSSDLTSLFEAISDEEIVMVCQNCAFKENLPLLRKPTEEQIKESKIPYSRKEVFARISSFKQGQNVINSVAPEKIKEETHEKVTLNLLQERMIRQRESKKGIENSPVNLIENFHWYIMRARRLAKLTTKELAERLKEDENSIKMLETGKIPRGVEPLIKKIEQYLKIRLTKIPSNQNFNLKQIKIPSSIKNEVIKIESQKPWVSDGLQKSNGFFKKQKAVPEENSGQKSEYTPKFSQDKLKNITIDDLVKMKKEREEKKPESKITEQ